MSMHWIQTECGSGSIDTAIKEAKKLANKLDINIKFNFIGVTMYITKTTNIKEAINYYVRNVKV